MKIVFGHLEIVNILLVLRLFAPQMDRMPNHVRCDNQVVHVLKSGKMKDPFLAACVRNVWFWAQIQDVRNQVTDLCPDGLLHIETGMSCVHTFITPYGWW